MALLKPSVAFHGSDIKPDLVLLSPSVTGRPPLCPTLALSLAHSLQQPWPFCPIELTTFFLLWGLTLAVPFVTSAPHLFSSLRTKFKCHLILKCHDFPPT